MSQMTPDWQFETGHGQSNYATEQATANNQASLHPKSLLLNIYQNIPLVHSDSCYESNISGSTLTSIAELYKEFL